MKQNTTIANTIDKTESGEIVARVTILRHVSDEFPKPVWTIHVNGSLPIYATEKLADATSVACWHLTNYAPALLVRDAR